MYTRLQLHSFKTRESGSVQPAEHAFKPSKRYASIAVWHWRDGQTFPKAALTPDATSAPSGQQYSTSAAATADLCAPEF